MCIEVFDGDWVTPEWCNRRCGEGIYLWYFEVFKSFNDSLVNGWVSKFLRGTELVCGFFTKYFEGGSVRSG